MIRIIQNLPLTFFSPSFYSDLVRTWRGVGMGFVLVLALIDCVGMAVVLSGPARHAAAAIPEIAAKLPEIAVKNGAVSMSGPAPFRLDIGDYLPVEEGRSRVVGQIVIDPDYAFGNIDALAAKMKDEDIIFLVTRHEMISFQNQGINVRSLKAMPDGKVTHEMWVAWSQTAAAWLIPAMAAMIAIFTLLADIVMVLLAAAAARLIGTAMKTIPDFTAAMRVAAATSIPVAVLLLAFPHHGFLIKALLWGGYMAFAAWSARREPQPPFSGL